MVLWLTLVDQSQEPVVHPYRTLLMLERNSCRLVGLRNRPSDWSTLYNRICIVCRVQQHNACVYMECIGHTMLLWLTLVDQSELDAEPYCVVARCAAL